jgi:hypothetical protein
LAPPVDGAIGDSIDCPIGWTWDPCVLTCVVDLPDPEDLDKEDFCICPEVYEPVECGGEEYSNKCFAGCDGALDCIPLVECICIEIYAPV